MPISLPSLVSEVLERCVFLNTEDRLYEVVRDCQHGFIREKCTSNRLLEILDHVGSLPDGEPRLPTANVARVRIWRQPLAVV